MDKSIPLTGIVRNLPDNVVADGTMQEVINLRPEDGAWRPVGRKTSYPTTSSDVRYIHTVDETYKVHLGTPGGALWYWVFKDGEAVASVSTGITLTGKQIGFCQLHNTLLLANKTDKTTILFIFNVDSERYLMFSDGLPDLPEVWFDGISMEDETNDFTVDVTGMDAEEKAGAAAGIVAHWADKYHAGKIAIRYAWELSDGTIARPSAPIYLEASYFRINASHLMWGVHKNVRYGTNTPSADRTVLKNTFEGIIRSLNIYATRIHAAVEGEDSEWASPVFKELSIKDETGFYLIHSIPLDGLDDTDNWSQTFLLPGVTQPGDKFLPGPFENLETRPSMTTDNFTYHHLSGRSLYAYNGRMWFADIMTRIYHGYPVEQFLAPVDNLIYPGTTPYSVTFEVEIYTSDGVKKVTRSASAANYYHDYSVVPEDPEADPPEPDVRPAFLLKRYFAYPDARARRLRIYIQASGDSQRLVATLNLTPHETLNFSAYLEESVVDEETIKGYYKFEGDLSGFPIQVPGTVDDSYTDSNRIQATELNNPFVFPAINSYRVGNGRVLGMATNAIALSTGQYGQYPVYCFCSDGIYALTVGNGDPLIQSVVPVSRVICNNPLSITQIDGGVAFTTARGLFIISGPRPEGISNTAEGKHLSRLTGTVNYEAIANNPNLYQIRNYLCNVEFLSYLAGAVIGYDANEDRPELIITNPLKTYSWVFSLQSKSWYKISESFERIVPDYPHYYGYRHIETAGTTPFLASSDDIPASSDTVLASAEYVEGTINYLLCSLSEEDYTDLVPVHMETRPIKLSGHKYKKIQRLLVGGKVNDSLDNPFSVNLFGSVDDKSWYLLNNSKTFASKDRLLIGRTSHSCMYFILVIGGKVDEDSYFTHMEVEFDEKFRGRLR